MEEQDNRWTRQAVWRKTVPLALSGLTCLLCSLVAQGCSTSQTMSSPWADLHTSDMVTNPGSLRGASMGKGRDQPGESPPATAADYEASGDRSLQSGNRVLALSNYEKALQLDHGSVEVRYKIGMLFLQDRHPEEAQRYFLEALERDTRHLPTLEALGEVSLLLKQDEAAHEYLRQALALDDTRWRPHALQGILHDRRGRHGAAIQAYLTGLEHQPNRGELYNNLGVSYYLDGQFDLAAQAFRDAVRLGSNHAKVYNNLGLALSELGDYEGAFEAFANSGHRFQAYNNLGAVLLQDGYPEAAVGCFQRAIDSNSTYYEKANENLRRARKALMNGVSGNGERPLEASPCDSGFSFASR